MGAVGVQKVFEVSQRSHVRMTSNESGGINVGICTDSWARVQRLVRESSSCCATCHISRISLPKRPFRFQLASWSFSRSSMKRIVSTVVLRTTATSKRSISVGMIFSPS